MTKELIDEILKDIGLESIDTEPETGALGGNGAQTAHLAPAAGPAENL